MAKLHYVSVMSLDGYIGDGHYNWSLPAEGSTAFITRIMRPIGIYLYGRKNFETMSFWESPDLGEMGEEHREFTSVWQSAEKVVYSKTLKSATTRKTRLERDYDAQKIREMKAGSAKDLCIGGPTLAAQAIRDHLVDEIHLFMVPTTIGNGIPVIPVLPKDAVLRLELLEECRFSEGWVYLRYRVQT
ncbi:MAG: dihydrofolate reductase family protein [Bdellovibrionaceae bacterium]|nr:dihydrofolate reductase family protein [Pseudobdellovibrionaceae bacterium]MBX3035212.1 dihydrofolate reductase family protein [Pseudobdellovibrionaceae bacterium]